MGSSLRQAVPIIITSMSSLQDLQLVCHLCGQTFVFSAGEQELLRVRGIADQTPKRCPSCKRRPPTVPYLPQVAPAH